MRTFKGFHFGFFCIPGDFYITPTLAISDFWISFDLCLRWLKWELFIGLEFNEKEL